MPLLVRVRPNLPYLLLVLLAILVIAAGANTGGVPGVAMTVAGCFLLIVFGIPLIVSTILRVPVLAIDETGLRLPIMGVRLSWAEVSSARVDVRSNRPILLVVPTAPEAVVRQARPWLRAELRRNIARQGAPIILSAQSLDHSVEDVVAAIRTHHPAAAQP